MSQRIPSLDDRERVPPVRRDHRSGQRDRVRAMVLALLCIAVFNGAHIVYRASHALDWYDIRMLLATEANTPGHREPRGEAFSSIEASSSRWTGAKADLSGHEGHAVTRLRSSSHRNPVRKNLGMQDLGLDCG